MEHDHFPFSPGRHLTLELFDYYVAKARVERAKAIGDFAGRIARQLRAVAVRFASRAGRPRSAPAARKLAG